MAMTAGKLKNLWTNSTLSGDLSYFDYELAVGREILVPWLKKQMLLEGLHIGDFGCHQGGILQALRETGGVSSGRGYDLNEAAIKNSPFLGDMDFSLQIGDVTLLDATDQRFNLIMIRDVLEHIPNYETVVDTAYRCLQPGGHLFISFPPYYSPFGGHQQLSSNVARIVPYLHYLPEWLLFKLVKITDTSYMSAACAREDMESVRHTRLTLTKAEHAFKRTGFHLKGCQYFLSRPEFKIRYGIPALDAGVLGDIAIVRELLVMGVYYLLQKPGHLS